MTPSLPLASLASHLISIAVRLCVSLWVLAGGLSVSFSMFSVRRENQTARGEKESPEVLELSALLNRIESILGQGESTTYRNGNGVYMKMMNFRRFDPEFTSDGKVGLIRGNKDEEVVWNEFSSDLARLTDVVNAIRTAVGGQGEASTLGGVDEPDFQEAAEGRVLTRMHRVRERSRKLVEAAKAAALKKHGRRCCEACGFNFSLKYGAAGEGLIDVHHTKPVHTLGDGAVTKLEDLALLCSNCHRFVHASRKWRSVPEVRSAIQAQLQQ